MHAFNMDLLRVFVLKMLSHCGMLSLIWPVNHKERHGEWREGLFFWFLVFKIERSCLLSLFTLSLSLANSTLDVE